MGTGSSEDRGGDLERIDAVFADFLPLPLSDLNVARVERWRTDRLAKDISGIKQRSSEHGAARLHPVSAVRLARCRRGPASGTSVGEIWTGRMPPFPPRVPAIRAADRHDEVAQAGRCCSNGRRPAAAIGALVIGFGSWAGLTGRIQRTWQHGYLRRGTDDARQAEVSMGLPYEPGNFKAYLKRGRA